MTAVEDTYGMQSGKAPKARLGLGRKLAVFTSLLVVSILTVTILVSSSMEERRAREMQTEVAIEIARLLRQFAVSYYHDLRIDELKVALEDVIAHGNVTFVYILDGDDTILVDGESGADRIFEAVDDPLSRQARAAGETQLETRDGLIHVAEPIPFAKGETGTVHLAVSLNDIERSTATIRKQALLIGGLFAVLGVVASALLARRVTHPLSELSLLTERIAAGDFTQRARVSGHDEIAALGSSFNRMMLHLDQSNSEIHRLAYYDSLTEVPNRVLFNKRLRESIESARLSGTSMWVLCLDLDHFKDINDSLGHAAGDVVLQRIAGRLADKLSPDDMLARLGGDEFAVVRTEASHMVEIEVFCNELLAEVCRPIDLNGREVLLGTSIGVARFPDDGRDAETLLKNADLAMFRAKSDGRNLQRFFEASMQEQLDARKSLEHDLRHALANDELAVHYQPLFEMRSNRLVGAEALLRWRHPVKGMVSPAEFIPLAEDIGIINEIGDWVLRTACREAAGWSGLKVAVNLSPIQFRDSELVGKVAASLAATGLPARLLELEITEGVLLKDLPSTAQTLTDLKELGIHIAIDDFGTGYSSLSYLRRFPFDKLKIDRSFVTELGIDASAASVVSAIVNLGHGLGMRVNAEGIETKEQSSILRTLGCDEAQGYHYGRPCAASEFTRLFGGNAVTALAS